MFAKLEVLRNKRLGLLHLGMLGSQTPNADGKDRRDITH